MWHQTTTAVRISCTGRPPVGSIASYLPTSLSTHITASTTSGDPLLSPFGDLDPFDWAPFKSQVFLFPVVYIPFLLCILLHLECKVNNVFLVMWMAKTSTRQTGLIAS